MSFGHFSRVFADNVCQGDQGSNPMADWSLTGSRWIRAGKVPPHGKAGNAPNELPEASFCDGFGSQSKPVLGIFRKPPIVSSFSSLSLPSPNSDQ